MTLAPACDYERSSTPTWDRSTGGHGLFPVEDLPIGLVEEVRDQAILPVLREMGEHGDEYTGFLYVGLVLTEDGPQVLEFNCRLGDPEAQVVLPRLQDDLVGVMFDAIEGQPAREPSVVTPRRGRRGARPAGYPDNPRTGDRIGGTDSAADLEDVLLFHAATAGDARRPLPQVAVCSTSSGWAMTSPPPQAR